MDGGRLVGRTTGLLVIACGMLGRAAGGEPRVPGEAFAARLIRPERQAAEVMRLFEGARWSDPAAALAAWKAQHPDTGLGKPVEALIAVFNPEMAHEWRALDDAEIRVGLDPATGQPGWLALIPRDDGAVAAGITAMRLTYPDDGPVVVDGQAFPVARLGRSGLPLACQLGKAVVVASSRGRLERGLALARGVRDPWASRTVDSGTVFRLEPERIPTLRDASLSWRRAIEALHASGCRRLEGLAFLKDGLLVVDVTTNLESRGPQAAPRRPRGVDRAWLEGLPSEGVRAMFTLAIDPDPSSWDRAFATADRVERVDPARAGLAPLRTRLNLLALGAGVKLEADIRPHLIGITACAFGDPARPGRVAGALVWLHLDDPSIAARLVQRATPRLAALVGDEALARAVTLRSRGCDIAIAWGDPARKVVDQARPVPGHSLADLCCGWAGEGPETPSRVGAFWPARIWRPAGLNDAAARALDGDPPVVWWGWSGPDRTRDLFRWAGLRDRVRGFLASLPDDTAPEAPIPAARLPEKNPRTKN